MVRIRTQNSCHARTHTPGGNPRLCGQATGKSHEQSLGYQSVHDVRPRGIYLLQSPEKQCT